MYNHARGQTGLSSFVLRESKTLKSRDISWLSVWLLEVENNQVKSKGIPIHTMQWRYLLEDDGNSNLLTKQWIGSYFICLRKGGGRECLERRSEDSQTL